MADGHTRPECQCTNALSRLRVETHRGTRIGRTCSGGEPFDQPGVLNMPPLMYRMARQLNPAQRQLGHALSGLGDTFGVFNTYAQGHNTVCTIWHGSSPKGARGEVLFVTSWQT